jgi:hypothetical protein
MRAFGISSANWRSCSALGFQTTDFGSTGSLFVVLGGAVRVSVMKVLFSEVNFSAVLRAWRADAPAG